MRGTSSEYTCPDCKRTAKDRPGKFVVCQGSARKGHKHTIKMIETRRGIITK